MSKPRYYECEICHYCHPWTWNNDCRDDDNRRTRDQLDDKHGGPDNWLCSTMKERVTADEEEGLI